MVRYLITPDQSKRSCNNDLKQMQTEKEGKMILFSIPAAVWLSTTPFLNEKGCALAASARRVERLTSWHKEHDRLRVVAV